jgi:hypothetical protein
MVAAMTDALVRLNPTRLRRFYKCEYDWFAYAVLGIDRLKPAQSPHRDRGKAFHALVEYAFRSFAESGQPYTFACDAGQLTARTVLYQLYKVEGTSLSDEDSYSLLDGVRFQLERFDMAAWEVVRLADGTPLIEADLRWRPEAMPEIEVQAKVDLVLRRRATGKVWAIDFKSTIKPIDTADVPPYIEHDDQLGMTRAVLAANGVKVDHSALLHLRSLAPTEPPLVYKGQKRERTTQSVDALSCDWETYRATLTRRGENPDSAEALKVKEGLACQTFARWQTDITDEQGQLAMQANWWRAAARMLAFVKGEATPVRRLNQSKFDGCAKCDYGPWCRSAMRNGGEPDLALLGTDYEARDNSPFAGRENYDASLFDPAKQYVRWAAEHGRTIEPHQEFTP